MRNYERKKPSKKLKNVFYVTAAVLVIVAIWWIIAETAFKKNGVVPPPPEVLRLMGASMANGALWLSVWNTFWKVFLGFLISFLLGLICAVAGARFAGAKSFLSPVISVLRAIPTLGVTIILFMVFRLPETAAIVVGIMMIFPMLYEGFLTAFGEVDKRLLEAAKVYKMPFRRQLSDIYAPQMAPYLFGAGKAAFGMNLKVVIAAEIIGIPVSNTLGTAMFAAKQSMDYSMLFTWVFVAVLLSFLIEGLIKLAAYLSMPWKRV